MYNTDSFPVFEQQAIFCRETMASCFAGNTQITLKNGYKGASAKKKECSNAPFGAGTSECLFSETSEFWFSHCNIGQTVQFRNKNRRARHTNRPCYNRGVSTNRIYDLKANILKIKGAIFETFLAFAEILSAMAAYQLGDFTGFFVSSESRF